MKDIQMTEFQTKHLSTDVLIIGGGTAGCYAAIKLAELLTEASVLVAEKANIRRSGCLAAGVNALNAYISAGHTPEDYVEYARKDAAGIVRDDLLLSMSRRLNEVTEDLEKRGLVILKDEAGNYVTRGWRNVKINGENKKPLLAEGVRQCKNVTVLNHVNLTDLKTVRESLPLASGCLRPQTRVTGAVGFSVREPVFFDIDARAVLLATGGAAGLYRPNNPGFSRHKMWYPPFNTGAGFAMGIRAGAEMTTFENRFVALRCKDTIAPTGTIAQGVGAKQTNSRGEVYETAYGLTTPERIYGTVRENELGHGPCYLATKGIRPDQEEDLEKAYLNMAPAQTLKWMESGAGPSQNNVEVEGTEPYVVGGHTASGFWVDTGRRTTLRGLYAAGDVAGGAPQKYVTGALAEGAIAAESIAADLKDESLESYRTFADEDETAGNRAGTGFVAADPDSIVAALSAHFDVPAGAITWEQVEEAMQKVMDEYAGGITTHYRYNEARLAVAEREIERMERLLPSLHAENMPDLLHIEEVRERLTVCRVLIAHLAARKETRWHIFGENADYPEQDPGFEEYINSRMTDGKLEMIERPLVKGERYEHTD